MTNEELLLLLADRLENLIAPTGGTGPVAFLMSDWVQPTFSSTSDRSQHICGTAACALGHAALMPEFQERGLFFQRVDEEDGTRYKIETPLELNDYVRQYNGNNIQLALHGDPRGVISRLFGISEDDEHWNVIPVFSGYPRSPRQVAWQIREFLRNGWVPAHKDCPPDEDLVK
jgi:hypothetical protein